IVVDVDVMMAKRKISVAELSEQVGITPANLAVLKNGRAKAVRFSTLEALCEALECQPGDILRWEPGDATRSFTDDDANSIRPDAERVGPTGIEPMTSTV